jgi:hypothetical protein
MLDDQGNETTPANTPIAKPAGDPWPPLPEPFDVRHITMSGGLFGGLDVIRSEYIDRSRPRRGWWYRLLHGL